MLMRRTIGTEPAGVPDVVALVVARAIVRRWRRAGVATWLLDADGAPVPSPLGEPLDLGLHALVDALLAGARYELDDDGCPVPARRAAA